MRRGGHLSVHVEQIPDALDYDDVDAELINLLQDGIGIGGAPFRAIAAELGLPEDEVVHRLQGLLDRGVLSRFGPLYDVEPLGGVFTLVAAEVPAERFERVASVVNARREVAHNYRREHRLNMWFVTATQSPEEAEAVLVDLEAETGLRLYPCPKLEEYHLDLRLDARRDPVLPERRSQRARAAATGVVSRLGNSSSERPTRASHRPDPLDQCIIEATEDGLPVSADPFGALARGLRVSPTTVHERLRALLASGAIRRIAGVPNHYRLGYRANGMSVWDVDDAVVSKLGSRVGALPFVSHCYRRPRHPGVWPYNLFAMLHGRSRDQVAAEAAIVRDVLGNHCRAHEILWSSQILKKAGFRTARRTPEAR